MKKLTTKIFCAGCGEYIKLRMTKDCPCCYVLVCKCGHRGYHKIATPT